MCPQPINQLLQSRLEVLAASSQSSFESITILFNLIGVVSATCWYDALRANTRRQLLNGQRTAVRRTRSTIFLLSSLVDSRTVN